MRELASVPIILENVARSQATLQSLGHGLQEQVAGRVPERVVDDLESIEIDEVQCDRPRASLGLLDCLLKSVV